MNNSAQQVSGSPGSPTAEVVVDRLLQVVPRTMRRIRLEMRTASGGTLTVPQLRALLFVRRSQGCGLSALAEHLGMTPPAASGLVDRLVRAGLLDRTLDPAERRRIKLRLTATGAELVGRAHLSVRSRLSAELGALSSAELGTLSAALELLAGLEPEDRDGRGSDDRDRRP